MARVNVFMTHARSQHDFVVPVRPVLRAFAVGGRAGGAVRPFASAGAVARGPVRDAVRAASADEQLALIRPTRTSSAGSPGRAGLTRESPAEQAAAGLVPNCRPTSAAFERYNAALPWTGSGSRSSSAPAITARTPSSPPSPGRLENPREQEIQTALNEICRIARLRLLDAVTG